MKRNSTLLNAYPIVAAHYGEKFGVNVITGAARAETNGDTIRLPAVSDDYPNKDVLWGYLTHEAAHVRYTDFAVWNAVPESESFRLSLLNVLEDVRIEDAIMSRFPGVRMDLDATVAYMKESNRFRTVTAKDEPARILQATLLYRLRNAVLQQDTADLADCAERALQSVFPAGVHTRLGLLMRRASTTRSTADCLQLTDDILKMLEEEAAKEEEKSSETKNSEKQDQDETDESSGSGESDKTDDQGEQLQDAADGSGSTDTPSESSDSSGDGAADSTSETQESPQLAAIKAALNAGDDDLDEDAFASLAQELNQEAENCSSGDYATVPVSREVDGDAILGRQLLQTVQSTTSKLRSQLMGLVQAHQRSKESVKRHGRKLSTKRLTRIVCGDTRIFTRREDRLKANTAVHILTDLSGSMAGQPEEVARESSLSIALALESIPGVNPAVTYFCGFGGTPVLSAVKHGESVRRSADKFACFAHGGTPMAEGIWHAAFQLSKQTEPRKVVVVITDGDPNNANASHKVIELCERSGIECIGIGIQHRNVSRFFRRHIVIDSVDELRTTLFKLMRDTLTTEAA